MSWPFNNPRACALYLSPTHCAIHTGAGSPARIQTTSIDQGLAHCAQALRSASKRPSALAVYIGASELRAAIVEPQSGAHSLQEALALAAHRLALDANWAVRGATLAPASGVLAIAVKNELIHRLQALAQENAIKGLRIHPAFLSPLRRWAAGRGQASAALIAEPGALTTVQNAPAAHGGSNLQLIVQQVSHTAEQDLAREMKRLRLSLGEQSPLHLWQLSDQTLHRRCPQFSHSIEGRA